MFEWFNFSPSLTRAKGFTLVELIVIIALLGILSAVAIARFGNVQTFHDLQLKDQLISIARAAQQMALNRYNQAVTLDVGTAANGDWLFDIQVDGLSVKQLEVERANSTLVAPAALPYQVNYDNLGNLAGGVDENLVFSASDRIVCITLSGYAYLATDSNDCQNN